MISNDAYSTENDFIRIESVPNDFAVILEKACYDCHSDKPRYPWYSYIAPFSWSIQGHINNAREHLNFTDWKFYSVSEKKELLQDCIDEIKEDAMPLKSYLVFHPKARLTSGEKKKIISYFKSL